MRRHLSLSLESFSTNVGHVVSMEEEQVMMSDAADLASDINQELNEVDRIVELSDALEDLAAVADTIEAASPTEIALMETAGDIAVAGTDIEAEEVVPSLESYRGKKIAAESFRQTAGNLWKNIQAFLAKIWEKINQFFYNIFGVIPRVRKRLQGLRSKLEKIQSLSPRGTTFELDTKSGGVGSLVARLATDGKLPRNDSEFIGELKKIHEFTKFVFGANIINRNALGVSIAEAIERFNPTADLDGQANLIVEACKKFNDNQVYPGPKGTVTPSGSYQLSRSETLMGGATLVHKLYTQADSRSTLGNMDRLRHSGLHFDQVMDKNNAYRDRAVLPTVSQTTMLSMIVELEQILDLLEEYKRGAASKQVEATRKRLESASKKASATYDHKNDSDEVHGLGTVAYVKSMLNFNNAYHRWISDPAVPFARYAMSEVNAVMAFIDYCMQTYEQGQKR